MREEKERNSGVYTPLFLALMLVAGLFIGNSLGKRNQGPILSFSGGSSSSDKIAQVLDMIDSRYVDPVEKEELVDAVLDDLLQQLDPHSDYITSAEFAEMQAPLTGSFEGIGVEFQIQRDTVVVIDPVDGGPSESAGILAGDRFLIADGTKLHGKEVSNKVVQETLRGPKRSKVSVQVYRPSTQAEFEVQITRGKIPINSVVSSFMLDAEIGYLKLIRFANTTADEFEQATDRLLGAGMSKMILDLRGNGGGYLHIAEFLADEFLERGKLIVYTQGKSHPRKDVFAKNNGKLKDIELVVLIDEGSASASEVLAGALQDNDRGMIVGRRSFGKGLVQDQAELLDQSAIRLTTARYYTPSGRSIQKPYGEGIDYESDYQARQDRGGSLTGDSIQQDTTEQFKTVGGRIVYGGGGITPDVFVPIDTSGGSVFLTELFFTGLMRQFSFDQADTKRNEFGHYQNAETFARQYTVPQSMVDELVAYAEQEGLKADPLDLERSREQILLRLKANIARNVWGTDGFYPIILQGDNMKDKAVELLTH